MTHLSPPSFPPVKDDLQTRFGSIYDEKEQKAMLDVLAKDAPTSSVKVMEFERKFAEFCNTKYAIAVSNGTAALMMAFKALDIQPGDEVITTPITWIATAAAAQVLGAKIIFGDINPQTFNLDPKSITPLITSKTKAICPVHLYGQPVDMKPIMEIAEQKGLKVIEDSAHAPGGVYQSQKTGSIGAMGCFSFHEQKNMSTLGEGGMITTNDPELYERARSYKSHCARVIGESSKYLSFMPDEADNYLQQKQFWYQDFDDCGYNYRMNDVTAAVGLCQLEKLRSMNDRRNQLAQLFDSQLANLRGVSPLETIQNVYHTYHFYPIVIDPKTLSISRDELIYRLRMEKQIKTGIHYMPLVQTTAFRNLGYSEKDAPIAAEQWPNLITLPIHPRMKDEDIEYITTSIKEIIKKT